VLIPAALALCFIRDSKVAFTVLMFTLCAFYGGVILLRLVSVLLAMIRSSEHIISKEEIDALQDADLPVYTILVPMYKEPQVAQKIARTVTRLDYPIDKLDVKLLLEEDDAPTRQKIAEVIDSLPPCVEVVLAPAVPKGQPKTKPRACNHGLDRAKGKYTVIYDAEDQPEGDQLKKAIIAFRRLENSKKGFVACLQAKLNYFNAHQNSLTRFFTLEYTTWFDLFLPGLHAVRTPIPLGGTSNHFKTDVLKELGGWDPFNVTEDCDLGIRMARRGFSTEVLDSTTWEEANSQVGNWIRQRSRWIKGYFQTHLVHTRDSWLPLAAIAAIFMVLYQAFTTDMEPFRLAANAKMVNWEPESLRKFIDLMRMGSVALAGVALLCSLYSLGRRFTKRSKGSNEGNLGLWKALTFRFTVGGLSLMLLLNMFFWVMTFVFIFRQPISDGLSGTALGRVKVHDTTTLVEALRGWEIYYTNVKNEERFPNVTLWNTASSYMNGQITWSEVKENVEAVDDWSKISQVFYPVAIMLFLANFVFVLLGLISCHKRRLWSLFPYALLMPFYWILISIAAIKGFFQLFTNPWYWEKTEHGLSPSEPASSAGPPAGQVERPQSETVHIAAGE